MALSVMTARCNLAKKEINAERVLRGWHREYSQTCSLHLSKNILGTWCYER